MSKSDVYELPVILVMKITEFAPHILSYTIFCKNCSVFTKKTKWCRI